MKLVTFCFRDRPFDLVAFEEKMERVGGKDLFSCPIQKEKIEWAYQSSS